MIQQDLLIFPRIILMSIKETRKQSFEGATLKQLKNNCKKEVKYALSFIKIEFLFLSLHLKNYQNFKGGMINGHSIDSNTLRQRIEAMPEDCILFRSDFPEYHAEFVGGTLSELANEGVLTKIAPQSTPFSFHEQPKQ